MSRVPVQYSDSAQGVGALMELANRRHRAGELEVAQELYHRIMESDPSNPDVYHQLGILALQREAMNLAQHYFRLAAELDAQRAMPGPETCQTQAMKG